MKSKMFTHFFTLTIFCLLGVVDQIQGQSATVELSDSSGHIDHAELPLWVFPCAIEEGTTFYANMTDQVLEIRCGEPPE